MAYLMLPTTMFAQLKNDYFFCVDDSNCPWEGLNCLGDATLILAAGTTNTIKGSITIIRLTTTRPRTKGHCTDMRRRYAESLRYTPLSGR